MDTERRKEKHLLGIKCNELQFIQVPLNDNIIKSFPVA